MADAGVAVGTATPLSEQFDKTCLDTGIFGFSIQFGLNTLGRR